MKKIPVYLALFAAAALLASLLYLRHKRVNGMRLPSAELAGGVYRYEKGSIQDIPCGNPLLVQKKVRFNNEGLRGPDLLKDRDYVAVFGDSFVAGACLGEEETLPAFLAGEASSPGAGYTVANCGMFGYNLKSALILANQLTGKYRIRTAVVHVLMNDDLLDCDISCQQAMKDSDPAGYEEFARNMNTYVSSHQNAGDERILDNFRKFFSEQVLRTGLHRKTKLLFVLVGREDTYRLIKALLDAHGIASLLLDTSFCRNGPGASCKVPFDGHPSGYYNARAARQIAQALRARAASPAEHRK